MSIDGKIIAETLLIQLKNRLSKLLSLGVTPRLCVILIGDDPGSLSYIRQKSKASERIGAQLLLHHLPTSTTAQFLTHLIEECNNDMNIHGVIVQRPIPPVTHIDDAVLTLIRPSKDVDGFSDSSLFEVPVARAVITILSSIQQIAGDCRSLKRWLGGKSIVVIGRGQTAGKPIAAMLRKHSFNTTVIHSQTTNAQELLHNADVIISCVGKKEVIHPDQIKPGVILISVGLWRDDQGKLHGDYEEEHIKNIASFFTPTPGGVGPVNVACLMDNLVRAAEQSVSVR